MVLSTRFNINTDVFDGIKSLTNEYSEARVAPHN